VRTVSIKIGAQKRSWVAGLQWTSQDHAPSVGDIRQEASLLRANLYIKRKPVNIGSEGARHDVGYGSLPTEGRRAQHYSLGALLAQVKKGKWSATFDLGASNSDLFLYVAILEGNTIDPTEYGEVVGSRSDVDKARESHRSMDLAHTEYGFDDLCRLVDEFTGEMSRVVLLNKQTVVKPIPVLLSAAAVGVVAVAGLMYLHGRGNSTARIAQMRLDAAALLLKQKESAKPQVGAVDPLAITALPADLQRACGEIVNTTPVARNGWVVSSIICGQGGVKVVWTAGRYAMSALRPDGVVSDDGRSVTSQVPLNMPAAGAGQQRASLDAEIGDLRDVVQRAGGVLEVHSGLPHLPGDDSTASSSPGRQGIFTVKLSWAPWSVPFSKVTGLRIDTIKFDGSTWIVGGSVYGS